jgi:hypothetical protein
MSKHSELSSIRPMIWVLMLGVIVIFGLSAWLTQKEKPLPVTEPTKSQAGSPEVADSPYDKLPIPNHRVTLEPSHDEEPFYQDTPLSGWLDTLKRTQLNWNEREAYEEARQAIRNIGPQAVPFLMKEFEGDKVAWSRACAGFRALGELGESAVPELFQLVERHPGYVPEALAAIGGPAVPALQKCLKNDKLFGDFPHALIPGNTMGGIHNAITVGRIPASSFYTLLPTIAELAKSDNPQSVAYAKPLLKILLAEMETEGTQ